MSTPDLAMILVRLMGDVHTRLPHLVPAGTAAGHYLELAAERPGPLIKQVRDVLRRMANEWEVMKGMSPTPENAALLQERIPISRAVKSFIGHIPRTPLTEPIVSALVTSVDDSGAPVRPPPWCPVSQGDMIRACRVGGRDGTVLMWVFQTLAGWYAATEPTGPARVDVQAMYDGAEKASRHERKEGVTLEALATKLGEGIAWMQANPVSLMKLLTARTWDDIETAPAAQGTN